MRVNVPRLVTAYFAQRPEPNSLPGQRVRFGASGHRGSAKVEAASARLAARPSGTEDAYKIHAESFLGSDHLRQVLEEAQATVDDALRAVA